MSYENLLYEKRDGIATITVNRPKVLNALNARTVQELDEGFAAVRNDAEVGAAILTGAGEKSFVAGADINELAVLTPLQAQETTRRGQAVLDRIESLGKPVIAAINGYALGGGCELAMACTLRVAAEHARLGQPEVKLGIIPGYGGTQRLPRLVGAGRALEIVLSGEPITAQEAYRIGLVNRVVAAAELIPACEALAKKIMANGPLAVQFSIEAVNRGWSMTLAEGLNLEAILFALACASEDSKEGTRAFLEKRAPSFCGR